MNRLSAFSVVVLGLVLTAPARAQSAESAIADAGSLVRRAAEPFVRQAEADACVRDLARTIVGGRSMILELSGEGRTRAADALNVATIHAAFGRVTATRGLDVTRDLLPIADARAFLVLEHLTDAQRELVLRCLTVLHDLSRRPTDERNRSLFERDLGQSEGDLRAMVPDPVLTPYLRALASQHSALVRELRARRDLTGLGWVNSLAHVGTVVGKAYVDARTPGVGPQPVAREIDLRGLPPSTRTGAVLPCALRLDAPNAPKVARWDVETIDAAGARVWLTHVAPASTSFQLFAPSKPGRHVVLVSALLEDDRVLARAFPLEVTGDEVPTVGMDGRPLTRPAPTTGLAGTLAGRDGSAIRVTVSELVVPGKGGSIRIDFDGSTPKSFTLELVGPGADAERRVLCRDEPLEASAIHGSTMVLSLGAHEVPAAPTSWRVVVTARRADGTTTTAAAPLAVRGPRRVS